MDPLVVALFAGDVGVEFCSMGCETKSVSITSWRRRSKAIATVGPFFRRRGYKQVGHSYVFLSDSSPSAQRRWTVTVLFCIADEPPLLNGTASFVDGVGV